MSGLFWDMALCLEPRIGQNNQSNRHSLLCIVTSTRAIGIFLVVILPFADNEKQAYVYEYLIRIDFQN